MSAKNKKKLRKKMAFKSKQDDCSICLDAVTNRAFTNTCFHSFCFRCLVEWSSVKSVCPLCKQPFKTIFHGVKSEDDYEEYQVLSDQPALVNRSNEAQRRFRYRTTMDTQNLHAFHQRQQQNMALIYGRMQQFIRQQQRMLPRDVRREVYRCNKWVRPNADRRTVRTTSPEFFKSNPTSVHRLVPWLNRELKAIIRDLRELDLQIILRIILKMITRVEILSARFRDHMQPFLGRNTMHFVHEFYHFASSPRSMAAYDNEAVYDNHNNQNQTPIEIDSPDTPVHNDDSDSDVIIMPTPENPTIVIDDEDVTSSNFDDETPGHSSWDTPMVHLRPKYHHLPRTADNESSSHTDDSPISDVSVSLDIVSDNDITTSSSISSSSYSQQCHHGEHHRHQPSDNSPESVSQNNHRQCLQRKQEVEQFVFVTSSESESENELQSRSRYCNNKENDFDVSYSDTASEILIDSDESCGRSHAIARCSTGNTVESSDDIATSSTSSSTQPKQANVRKHISISSTDMSYNDTDSEEHCEYRRKRKYWQSKRKKVNRSRNDEQTSIPYGSSSSSHSSECSGNKIRRKHSLKRKRRNKPKSVSTVSDNVDDLAADISQAISSSSSYENYSEFIDDYRNLSGSATAEQQLRERIMYKQQKNKRKQKRKNR